MNLFKFIRDDYDKDFTTLPKTFEKYRWYKPIFIIILAVIIYFILTILFANLIYICCPGISVMDFLNGEIYTFGGICGLLLVTFMIPSIYIPTRLIYKKSLASQISSAGKWNWNIYLKAILISIIVFLVYSMVEIWIDQIPIVNHFTIATFILCLIVTAFQSFAEEYVFRSFLMQTFGSWFRIPILAIILQSITFAISHEYNTIGLIAVLYSGICFGLLAWYSKGLEVSSAIHYVNNLTAFFAVGFGLQEMSVNIGLLDFVVDIALTTAIVALIIFLEKRYKWFGFEKNNDTD